MHRIVSVQDFLETIQRLQLLYVATPMRRGCEISPKNCCRLAMSPSSKRWNPGQARQV